MNNVVYEYICIMKFKSNELSLGEWLIDCKCKYVLEELSVKEFLGDFYCMVYLGCDRECVF